MRAFRRVFTFFLLGALALCLCSCGESTDARLNRLRKEEAQAKQAAKEAQDNYRQLKDFADKYGK